MALEVATANTAAMVACLRFMKDPSKSKPVRLAVIFLDFRFNPTSGAKYPQGGFTPAAIGDNT